MNKKATTPSWIEDIVNTDKKLPVEAFEQTTNSNLSNNMNYLVIASNRKSSKVNYALRIDEDINDELKNCKGSKNAVINALMKYAIDDLKKKGKTLIIE